MKRRKRFLENPYSGRVHILKNDDNALCGVVLGDDFIRRYNFPTDGNPCGACLLSRRRSRREARKRMEDR